MKRDWNLIRQLMLSIEQDKLSEFLRTCGESINPNLNDHDYRLAELRIQAERWPAIKDHLLLLKEGGLIEGDFNSLDNLEDSNIRITMRGYDVLEVFKLDDIWSAIATAVRAEKCPLTTAAILEVSKVITSSKMQKCIKPLVVATLTLTR